MFNYLGNKTIEEMIRYEHTMNPICQEELEPELEDTTGSFILLFKYIFKINKDIIGELLSFLSVSIKPDHL